MSSTIVDEFTINGKTYLTTIKYDNDFLVGAAVMGAIIEISVWFTHIPLMIIASIVFGMMLAPYGLTPKITVHEKE
jgi:hypothetical protein